MKNAAFELVHGVGLVVHNTKNPSKEEWDVYLEMSAAGKQAAAGDFSRFKQLVFTDGGAPNAAQRKASMDLVEGAESSAKVKVAVVSDSVVVRGIVTAFNWAGAPLRSYAPEQVEHAFGFLGVSSVAARDLCDAVEKLCATIDGPVRSAAAVKRYRAKLGA